MEETPDCLSPPPHAIILPNLAPKTPNIEAFLTSISATQTAPPLKLKTAVDDLRQGFLSWRIWLALGYQDIRLRYRRSQLGPFWITLSTAIMIYSMGFVYAKLFKVDLSSYYPYLAAGLVVWTFISSLILESTETFIENSGFIRQTSLPFSIYILRLLTRNFIILLHNILPVLPILIYYKITPSFLSLAYLIFGFVLLLLIAYSYGLLLAIMGSRFRDIKPIIASVVQICFLLTPILWQHKMLSERMQHWTVFNPFYQLVELLRAPFLGQVPAPSTILYCLCLAGFGLGLMLIVLAKSRHRIAFWV